MDKKISKRATGATTRKAISTAKSASKKANIKVTPRSVAMAGIGAGATAVERAQGEAMKIYTAIAKQADALRSMTTEAAETLATKTGLYVREGKKMQLQAVSMAQASADSTAKEVKAFAKKSKKALKASVVKTVDATIANAKDGVTKLEHVFESRVAKTLNTFGVPSAHNVRELQVRMADLQKALNQLNKRSLRA